MRAEYPVLVLFAAVGMGVMVSAGDLMTLYIGLELNASPPTCSPRSCADDNRSAEAGLKYFVLGALASGILLFGISLAYGFTGTTIFDGDPPRRRRGHALGRAVRARVRARRPGLQDQRGAVPHVDARRLRRRADAGHYVLRQRAQGRRHRACRARRDGERSARRPTRGARSSIFAALASIIVGALGGDRPRQHQAAAGLFVDQQHRLHPHRARLRDAAQGVASMLVYLAIYVAMTIGSFVTVLHDAGRGRRAAREPSPTSRVCRARGPALACCMAMMMFSLAGIPPLFGFWGKFVVFQAAVKADLVSARRRSASRRA